MKPQNMVEGEMASLEHARAYLHILEVCRQLGAEQRSNPYGEIAGHLSDAVERYRKAFPRDGGFFRQVTP